MTDTQIFQLLGVTFFAIGIGMVANPKFIKNILDELEHSVVNAFYGGLISLVIGYLLITFRNTSNNGIITVIGWLAIIKGLAFLVFPAATIRFYKKITGNKGYGDFFVWFIIALGIIFLYFGYFA
jgi:hypothetical protein